MNKIKIVLSLIVGLLSVNIVLADIPAPPAGQEIRIELNQNYSDYQFYLCSFEIEVKLNPNPPHPSRLEMTVVLPNSFQQIPIELSREKPFIQPIGDGRVRLRGQQLPNKVFYLVAVKKTEAKELEAKIKGAVENTANESRIKLKRLEDSLESKENSKKGAKTIVNRISFNQNGMELMVEEGIAGNSKTSTCLGIGLLLTGLALIGGLWTKKRFV